VRVAAALGSPAKRNAKLPWLSLVTTRKRPSVSFDDPARTAVHTYGASMTKPTYAPVNGLQLYYEVHGSGRPLVLLHGGLLTIDLNFGAMIPALARSHEVIAVEMQGHGHTADIDREMTLENFADDIATLLGRLGVDEADFFGYSLGGCVSLALLTHHPDLVGKLVLASTPTRREDFAFDGQLDPDRMPTAADGQEWAEAYRRVAPYPDRFDALIARLGAVVGAIEGWSADELRAIRVPTLILIGDRDFISIERAAQMLKLISNAQLAVLPGATHVGITRRPDQVLRMIAPFLDPSA
jgi:pimeloyl-ACP methyl ester carboxylesterase